MPFDSSNQGSYLAGQWLAGFKAYFSQALMDRFSKGFLQVKIRDPIPMNFPIEFPGTRGVFDRNLLTGGNVPPTPGGGVVPEEGDPNDGQDTFDPGDSGGGGDNTPTDISTSVTSGTTNTVTFPASATDVPATGPTSVDYTSGGWGPVGCGTCNNSPVIEGFLGTGCPAFYGGFTLCGSEETTSCPWTDYGSGPQCGPTGCLNNPVPVEREGIPEYAGCGDCPIYDWDCCYDTDLADYATLHYFGCCCNQE